MKDTTGMIFNIQRYSIHDGPGIRTTVFLKGCPLRCMWCQNPEGQSFNVEVFLNLEVCTGCGICARECPLGAIEIVEAKSRTDRRVCDGCGRCAEVCPSGARSLMGSRVSAEEVFTEVKKDRLFYERSGGGVTLSGGDPLAQPEFAGRLLELCRRAYIHTAVETCGLAEWPVMAGVFRYVDLLLYDIKHMAPEKHCEYTGVSNDLILGNLKKVCHELDLPVWIRIPVIPGYNDDRANMESIAGFISGEIKGCVERVNLLPYHRLGEAKFERLEASFPAVTEPPAEEQMYDLQRVFAGFGLPVFVGG